jgi:hypothetical protein
MPQVYVVAARAEVQNGSVQVTDLWPNQSQANLVLLRNVQADGAGGGALTFAEAKAAASSILARVYARGTLTLAVINGFLVAAAGAGTELTDAGGSDSTGSVEDILKILAGETYIVSAGTQIEDGAGAFVPVLGDSGMQSFSRVLVPNDSSWQISLSEGSLASLTTVRDQVDGDLFAGVRSTIPLVTVYAADGTIYA